MTEGLTVGLNELDDLLSDGDCEIDKQIKELKHEFHEALTDKPEILKYIERLHTIIRRQQKKLNKFYKKLKDHRLVRKYTSDNKESQTESQPTGSESWDSTLENVEKNLADEVKEVAENAMKQTSFVYEPTSGMYYDYNTGYYYNAELRMYYDGNTGQYLEYDAETKTYKYHSTVGGETSDSPAACQSTPSQKVKKSREKDKDRKTKRVKLDEAEEGEITESSVSGSESDSDEGAAANESGAGCEPCIRIMVEETNVDKLRVGSLFVVTCKGGTMGREGDHAVLVPDINVSKHHARFVFDPTTTSYYITDLGSRNGTWLDGERLSAALQESENFVVNHGAVIQIGSTKLLCHVHVGRDTCAACEPGLVQQTPAPEAVAWDHGPKHPEYREQLQNLKKKFGVDGASQDVYTLPGYEDRAEIRRMTVGSSHSSEKTQTASVNEVIPQCNKGFKMLSRMGWTEGQKLGKNDSGIAEPVAVVSNAGKSGLGMSPAENPWMSTSEKKRQDILRKTQDRYRHIEGQEARPGSESD